MMRFVLVVALLAAVIGAWSSVRRAHAEVDATSLLGKAAPDVSFATLDGKEVKSSDLKGHVVLLDFWATWCPPCKESLPHVDKVSRDKALADKGLKVYAINSQEPSKTVDEFMKKNGFKFAVGLDGDGKVSEAYVAVNLPTTIVIGKDGIIQYVVVGYNEAAAKEIDDAVNTALAK